MTVESRLHKVGVNDIGWDIESSNSTARKAIGNVGNLMESG